MHEPDLRSDARKLRDEKIAGEPQKAPPVIDASVQPRPVEDLLKKIRRRPLAVAGIVEHGLVRPLDPQVKFGQQSRVIIVASEVF